MKEIIVYGSGCKTCQNAKDLIRQVAQDLGVDVDVKEVTDTAEILAAGVMSTPGIAINGQIVHVGSIPERATIEGWLKG
ncbi:thioredoxin family protein [Thermopetrobacter sp. TC1]|uniref:thioredoxin family protein n=1 Tax=Thermopetrobacter sp. TC1 TaxID=1495045 RepID=UPI000571851D|nr:thioredoxin family protein [Thermopetrobacter sp. TC1]